VTRSSSNTIGGFLGIGEGTSPDTRA
jgi:hypothetical protein